MSPDLPLDVLVGLVVAENLNVMTECYALGAKAMHQRAYMTLLHVEATGSVLGSFKLSSDEHDPY